MTNQVAYTNTVSTVPVVAFASTPTIASGFGTNPKIAGATPNAFAVTVGSTTASNGTLTLPTAPNGWIAFANDINPNTGVFLLQTASSTTSITVTSYSNTSGAAAPMAAGDIILFNCIPY
jgi:hypothetical protein